MYLLGYTDRGSYLYLFETDKRPGYKAWFHTPLFKPSGTCMEFFYQFLGNATTKLRVSQINKDNVITRTRTLEGNGNGKQWER